MMLAVLIVNITTTTRIVIRTNIYRKFLMSSRYFICFTNEELKAWKD